MTLLVVAVPVWVALWLARAPVSPGRIGRFERRHRMRLSEGERGRVVDHLAHARLWRAFGAAAGYAADWASTFSAERVVFPVAATAAGWLVGAVVAELRSGVPGGGVQGAEVPGVEVPGGGAPGGGVPGGGVPGGGVLPVLLRRVPAVLAAVAVGCTVLLLLPGRSPERVLVWGFGALACAGAIVVVQRRVAGPAMWRDAGPAPAVRQAIATDVAGAVAGVGTALAAVCLTGQLSVIRPGYFDPVGSAVGLLAVVWSLGGIAVGWLVAHARFRPLTATVAVLVLFSAAALGVAWRRDRPPYPVSALQPSVTVRLTDEKRFDADARALGITGLRPLIGMPGTTFVGRVDYRPPPVPAPGTLYVAVIDKRRNRMAPQLFGIDGGGFNGFLTSLPRRYPWLSAMAAVPVNGGWTDPGMTVGLGAEEPGPIVFVGNFPEAAGLTVDDLMVVLIFTGPNQQTYWAERVLG